MRKRFLALAGIALAGAAFPVARAQIPVWQRDITTLERECAAGDATSCNQASGRYSYGTGVVKDIAKSAEYTLRACDAGDGLACYSYARGIDLGMPGHPAHSHTLSAGYALKGCRLKLKLACEFATNYAYKGLYSQSDKAFVLGQNARAAILPSEALAKDTQAKQELAARRAAAAKPVSVPVAGANLAAACDVQKNGKACERHAWNLGEQRLWGAARAYAEKACRLGSQNGCLNEKAFAAREYNEGVRARNAERARIAQEQQAQQQRESNMYQSGTGRRSNARDNSYTGSGSYVGSGRSSTSSSSPSRNCTESYTGGGSGVNGKGQRIVTCR